jgi:hypothetical protein
VAIAAAIFVAGYWFFETVFATGRAPIDLDMWWPVVIIAAGVAALLAGTVFRGQGTDFPSSQSNAQGGTS